MTTKDSYEGALVNPSSGVDRAVHNSSLQPKLVPKRLIDRNVLYSSDLGYLSPLLC